jgi:hypothetical protein
MESEAAEKLMSLIDLEVGDVFCFVVDLVVCIACFEFNLDYSLTLG